jgi:aromatic ring hydroxylase
MYLQVPKEAWHCDCCAKRIASRELSLASAFNDVEKYRTRAYEDQITELIVDMKVTKRQPEGYKVDTIIIIIITIIISAVIIVVSIFMVDVSL